MTFLKNVLLNGHYRSEEAKIFLKFAEIMDVRDETHTITHVMQLAETNFSAIFLGVKNTF